MRLPALLALPLVLTSMTAAAEPLARVVLVENIRSVYDGDTFRADIAGWPPIIGLDIPIRVAGIDTPELRSRCDTEEQRERERAMGRAARAMAERLLTQGGMVTLHNVQRGSFFRLVAEVRIDGESLGETLAAAGMAAPFEPSSTPWCLPALDGSGIDAPFPEEPDQ